MCAIADCLESRFIPEFVEDPHAIGIDACREVAEEKLWDVMLTL